MKNAKHKSRKNPVEKWSLRFEIHENGRFGMDKKVAKVARKKVEFIFVIENHFILIRMCSYFCDDSVTKCVLDTKISVKSSRKVAAS